MKTEKIGKISLILGAVLSILLIIAGFIIKQTDLFSSIFDDDRGNFFLFMLMPFTVMFISHLTAWLICLKTKKNNEPQKEESNKIAVFFKSYLYLWSIVTILIAVCGFIFWDENVKLLSTVFLINALIMGVVWFCTVIVCIMIWAAFNAWKANEFVGVIVAIISFIMFAGTIVLAGVLYDYYANDFKVREYDEFYAQEYGEYDENTEYVEYEYEDEYDDENYVYEEDDNETDLEKAFRFMKHRLELEHQQRAIDLIRNWGWYNSGRDNYDKYNENFNGKRDFINCKNIFYSLKEENMSSKSGLEVITNNFREITYENGYILSPSDFDRSGARDCLKILLLAYDDIYSKKNAKKILREMYEIMSNEEYWNKESQLRPYMSDEVIDEINGINNRTGSIDDVEWATNHLATWAYSFWARRYNDKIDKTVYTILKIIDTLYE